MLRASRLILSVRGMVPPVFYKDAIFEISSVQGSEFLHHPANMLLVLCRVRRLHDIPIGGNDHLVFPFTIPSAISSPHGNNTYLHAFWQVGTKMILWT